MIQIYSII